MRRILLTGGAGNIGSALLKRLLKEPDTMVFVVDNLSTGNLSNLPPKSSNFKFIKANTNDRSEMSDIMLANNFDFVFHYAALVGVKRTQENPIKVLEDIEGIRNMLTLAKNSGVKNFFFLNSSEIYGETGSFSQNEKKTTIKTTVSVAEVKNIG